MDKRQNKDDIEEIAPGEYSPNRISEKFDEYAAAKDVSADEMLAQAIQYMIHKER